MTHGNLVIGRGGGDSGVQHRSSVHFASFTESNSGHGASWPSLGLTSMMIMMSGRVLY